MDYQRYMKILPNTLFHNCLGVCSILMLKRNPFYKNEKDNSLPNVFLLMGFFLFKTLNMKKVCKTFLHINWKVSVRTFVWRNMLCVDVVIKQICLGSVITGVIKFILITRGHAMITIKVCVWWHLMHSKLNESCYAI